MTTSFKSAYGVLQRHAATLRDQSEPNIDDLLKIVTESVDAYKVCKQRIEAVEAALKSALDGVSADNPPAGMPPVISPDPFADESVEPDQAPAYSAPGPAPAPKAAVTRSTPAPKAPKAPAASFDDMDDDIPF